MAMGRAGVSLSGFIRPSQIRKRVASSAQAAIHMEKFSGSISVGFREPSALNGACGIVSVSRGRLSIQRFVATDLRNRA